ncbi:MAG: glycosyltransferase [Bacteroidetes bacterium]|nr:glycosyltransferase [Bacteroidota bacterium]
MIHFVIIAPQQWDFEVGSNARNIALEIAKRFKVIYINPPTDIKTLISKRQRTSSNTGYTRVNDSLFVYTPSFTALSINWIKNQSIYDLLNWFNNYRMSRAIRKATKELGWSEIVVLNDNYIFNGFYLKEMLRPKAYIYYLRDFLTIQPYFKKHGARLEPQLIRKVDAVAANSTYLANYARSQNAKSFYVGQGCEIEMFDPTNIKILPNDLKELPKPVIGYVGFLTAMRLDIGLLLALAKGGKWSLVLVGPEDEEFKSSALHQMENVFFLGRKAPDELPSYIAGFDVCINPQLINPLTIGNYPRKIDEYLAMGKPTVATATQAMDIFERYTYLANSHEQFVQQVRVALNDTDVVAAKTRIEFARSHTWENSVKEIYQVIEKVT